MESSAHSTSLGELPSNPNLTYVRAMNFMQSTTGTWIERGSLLLAGATLLGSTAVADPTGSELLEQPTLTVAEKAQPSTYDDLKAALQGGKFWVNLRARFEKVNEELMNDDAHATTLRTRLGYESAEYKNVSGVLEFSDVSSLGPQTYNDLSGTGSGNANRPAIVDPTGSQVNQVYAKYTGLVGSTIKAGRQRIILDNARFIGNVGWRQTEQTYDAFTFVKPDAGPLTVVYAYISNINTIKLASLKTKSHALNVSTKFEDIGKLTGYVYYLDVDDNAALSTATYGVRFDGERDFGDWAATYTGEYASQGDTADNLNDVSANYMHLVFGGKAQGAFVRVGYEVLEGSPDNNASRAFQTPLATGHAFNGWADRFLTTPAGGLEDLYLTAGYGKDAFKASLTYHQFEPETGSGTDYGSEIDLVGTYAVNADLSVGVKLADFAADSGGGYSDVTKAWFWLGYAF